MILTARTRLLARLFHPLQSACICLVAVGGCHIFEHVLVPAQCHCVDESQTVLKQKR